VSDDDGASTAVADGGLRHDREGSTHFAAQVGIELVRNRATDVIGLEYEIEVAHETKAYRRAGLPSRGKASERTQT
jgi:hypothetical protein